MGSSPSPMVTFPTLALRALNFNQKVLPKHSCLLVPVFLYTFHASMVVVGSAGHSGFKPEAAAGPWLAPG